MVITPIGKSVFGVRPGVYDFFQTKKKIVYAGSFLFLHFLFSYAIQITEVKGG